MMRPHRAGAAGLAAVLLLAACSSPSTSTQAPGGTTPPAATAAGNPTSAPAAEEPCSFLTAEQLGAITGTAPVEVKERVGRGDCDYWLDAGKTTKVNIGVTTGPDGLSLFNTSKGLGDPAAVSIGDEAYSIVLGELGTLVIVRKGDSVIAVQVLTTGAPADQLAKATALAVAVIAEL